MTGSRRTVTLWCFGGAALLLALAVVLWEISRARCYSLVGEAICRVETNDPMVARLTTGLLRKESPGRFRC